MAATKLTRSPRAFWRWSPPPLGARLQARPSRQVENQATGANDSIEVGTDIAETRTTPLRTRRAASRRGRASCTGSGPTVRSTSLQSTMQQIGLISALVLSIITDGCGRDLDPTTAQPAGPDPKASLGAGQGRVRLRGRRRGSRQASCNYVLPAT